MKTEEQVRAEYEAWALPYPDLADPWGCMAAWQACQSLNDSALAEKDAEIARMQSIIDKCCDTLHEERKDSSTQITRLRDEAREIQNTTLTQEKTIERLLEALQHYACENGCWAESVSGDNPLIGKPNTPFCHKKELGRHVTSKTNTVADQGKVRCMTWQPIATAPH